MDTPLLLRGQSLLGLIAFLALCYAAGCLRERRFNTVPWRVVGFGVGLQILLAALILRTTPGAWAFDKLNDAVVLLLAASEEGAALLFGNLARGMDVPTSAGGTAAVGAYFAFNVLPTIIFFSALLAVLYHTGLMTLVVGGLAWAMRRTMRTSGAETLSAAANVFVGQTEAPLFVRPFLAAMTASELFAVMTGGFANIASGVLGVYADLLKNVVPDAGSHLIAASVVSAPAGLVVAKLLVPERDRPQTADGSTLPRAKTDANLLDAAVRGTRDGLLLAANVGAVLIVFTAFVWLANAGLGAIHPNLSLERILGVLLAPVAWLCGVPWSDAPRLGSLIGVKTVLNEFLAYLALAQDAETFSPRSRTIAVYALCGFANFASVGIQIGGIGVLAPTRRADLARLGLLAMFGGAIASLLTACVVGMIL